MNTAVLSQISSERQEAKRLRREKKLALRDAELLTEFGKMNMMASWDDDVILPRHEFKPPPRELYENEKKQRKSRERPTTDQMLDEVLDEVLDDFKAEQEILEWDIDFALENEVSGLVDFGKIKNKRELSSDFLDFTAELKGFEVINYGDITFNDWLKTKRRAVGQGGREGGYYYGDEKGKIVIQDPNKNHLREEYERYVSEVKPREPLKTPPKEKKAKTPTPPKEKKATPPKEKKATPPKETAKDKKEREKMEANEKLKAIREAYQKEIQESSPAK